jgi:hypothetical protein
MITDQSPEARPFVVHFPTPRRVLFRVLLAMLCCPTGPESWITGSAPVWIARAAAAQPPSADTVAGDVDLGLFARVVTSDPARMDGAKAGRLEEFRAEDVFLSSQLAPRSDGTYGVPMDPNSGGAMGLEWSERRVLSRLELAGVAPHAVPSNVVIEYWSSSGREDSWGAIGQTPWQGRWERLPAEIEVKDRRWLATILKDAVPEFRMNVGVLKVRWRFPMGTSEIIVKRPSAFGKSVWQREALRIETAEPWNVTIDVYNGLLVDPDTEQQVLHPGPGPRHARPVV